MNIDGSQLMVLRRGGWEILIRKMEYIFHNVVCHSIDIRLRTEEIISQCSNPSLSTTNGLSQSF